jgi:hypothetical protein
MAWSQTYERTRAAALLSAGHYNLYVTSLVTHCKGKTAKLIRGGHLPYARREYKLAVESGNCVRRSHLAATDKRAAACASEPR